MFILTATTDKLQVILDGAITTNELKCYASYRVIKTLSGIGKEFTPARNFIATNGATEVDLVGSPSADYQHVVDYLSVFNSDTANAVVTINFNASGTLYPQFKVTLGTGEKLEYQDGQGFRVFNTSGAVKTAVNQANNATSSSFSVAVLGADVINNNAVANTIKDVTGLSFAVTAGKKYWFRFIIQYTAAATTTGSRWSVSGPTGTIRYGSRYTLTATTETIGASGVSSFDSPAASNASSVVAANIATIEGFFEPTADGDLIARFASEVTASAITAKAGSIVQFQEVL